MRQRNINFRQSHSERAGESSYKNFHRTIVRNLKGVLKLKFGGKEKYGQS
ncbi:MAG TPA: hypothetical protein VMR59_04395 [Patescibacteria group bacterium]|nr:hypothetical protein [Patescibacteria group bacterium]